MKKKLPLLLTVVVAAPLAVASGLLASGIKGSAPRGRRVFGACAACHSLTARQKHDRPKPSELVEQKSGQVAKL
jgi:cytochrome c2